MVAVEHRARRHVGADATVEILFRDGPHSTPHTGSQAKAGSVITSISAAIFRDSERDSKRN
jgi:hypothetical protein